ncbi:hypothetical protein NL317_30415, partial [Klebsiella pneumoniae]|nr:hypothetical protein [Klebsiella pneumoniae]
MKTKLDRSFDQLIKRYSPMYVIFLGAIIIVIGTAIAAIGTLMQNYNNAKKAKVQNDQIEALTLRNVELSKQLTNEALE